MANPTVAAMANQGLQFFDTLSAQQQQQYAGNQAALNTVSSMWAPVAKSGVIPFGYSPGLDSMLTANAIDTGAQATTNAENALDLNLKQASGGANVLPTGAQEQLRATQEAIGQQSTAKALQQEKIAGYAQGETNLKDSTNALLGVASAENPEGAASAATGAGNLATNAGAEQFKENQEGSLFSKVMSGIGTVSGAAKNVFAGGAGSAFAGMGG